MLEGISENLGIGVRRNKGNGQSRLLLAQEVSKTGDGVLGVFHQLVFGLISNVLTEKEIRNGQ